MSAVNPGAFAANSAEALKVGGGYAANSVGTDSVPTDASSQEPFGYQSWIKKLSFGWNSRLPLILQTEAAECGLASIAMVAGYHGYQTDLPSLRSRFSISLKGATLKQLIEIAQTLGFTCRPLRLELEELADLQVPCILHWELNHFVF